MFQSSFEHGFAELRPKQTNKSRLKPPLISWKIQNTVRTQIDLWRRPSVQVCHVI